MDKPRDEIEAPEDAPRRDGPPEVPPLAAISDQDRILLVFAYLGPLATVALLGSRDPFVRWHVRQGGGLTLTGLAVLVVLYPFDWFFSLIPLLGRVFVAAELLVGMAYLALVAMAIERALAGSKFRIPWLADLADED